MAFLDQLCDYFVRAQGVKTITEREIRSGSTPRFEVVYSHNLSGGHAAEHLTIEEKGKSECKMFSSDEERVMVLNIASGALAECLGRLQDSTGYLIDQVFEQFTPRRTEAQEPGNFLSERFVNFTYENAAGLLDAFYR